MEYQFAELVLSAQLRMRDAGLKPGDNVTINACTDNYPVLVQAYFTAAAGLGLDPVLIIHKAPARFGGVSDVIVEAHASADVMVELSMKSWIYHESHDRFYQKLTAHGGRVMYGDTYGWEEDVDHQIRLVPSDEVKERTRRATPLVDNAEFIRLTSDLGTDLIVERGDPDERPSFNLPGQAAFAPPPESANGVLYFQGGIRVQAPHVIKRMVYEPISIEIEKGKIVSIARDTESGIMLDDWFRSHNDPNSYHFAHINLGLDPRIHLEGLDNIATHFNFGAVLMGFGCNYTPLFGSHVMAKSHVELNYVGGDYWADDLCLTRMGEFTEDSNLRGPFDET